MQVARKGHPCLYYIILLVETIASCSVPIDDFEQFQNVQEASGTAFIQSCPRLSSIRNLTIRAVYDVWPPLFISPTTPMFHLELFEHICETLGLNIEYIKNPDVGVWAHKSPNGTWRGMMSLFVRDEADICVTGASMTPERTEIADFSQATTHFRSRMFVKASTTRSLNAENYIKEFSLTVWFLIVVTLIGSSLVLYMILFGLGNSHSTSSLKAMEAVYRAVLQKSTVFKKKSAALNVSIFSLLMFTLVVFSVYKCQMNAFLAVVFLTPPVRSLQDALDNGMTVAYVQGGVIEEIFSKSPEGSDRYQAHQNRLTNPLATITNLSDAILHLDSSDYALIQKIETMIHSELYPCSIIDVPDFEIKNPIVFPFKRDSAFLEPFDEQITLMKQSGLLQRLYKKHLERTLPECEEASGAVLGFANVITPFGLLAAGVVIGLAVALMETILAPKIRTMAEGEKSIKNSLAEPTCST